MAYRNLMLLSCSLLIVFSSGIGLGEAIINGHDACIGQCKYQVMIQANGDPMCGGAIIDDQHILTAAHCFINDKNEFDDLQFSIVAGVITADSDDRNKVEIDIEKIYVLKEFTINYDTLSTADIAVAKLSEKLNLGQKSSLKKVKLPQLTDINLTYENKEPIVFGFGYNTVTKFTDILGREFLKYSREGIKLKFAETKVIANSNCPTATANLDLRDSHICAQVKQRDPENPEGVSLGDSGGPLVLNEDTIIGILSIGPNGNEQKQAGIYTKVASYLSFIFQVIERKKGNLIRVATYKKTRNCILCRKYLIEIS